MKGVDGLAAYNNCKQVMVNARDKTRPAVKSI
jgi:hypothetical protein